MKKEEVTIKDERIEMRISLLRRNELEINWQKYAELLEDEVLRNKANAVVDYPEIQHGFLITGDGHTLNAGEDYYTVYENESFFIRKEKVSKTAFYASDFYHTRFKHKVNAEKFILDNKQKQYNQLQIKHACVHADIDVDKIEKMYAFLEKTTI